MSVDSVTIVRCDGLNKKRPLMRHSLFCEVALKFDTISSTAAVERAIEAHGWRRSVARHANFTAILDQCPACAKGKL